METRNVKISIDQALNWLKSDNNTLRTLALSAYTVEELTSYAILKKVEMTTINAPKDKVDKIKTLIELSEYASFYNRVTSIKEDRRYFIGKNDTVNHSSAIRLIDNIYIYYHKNVTFAGVIYFNSVNVLQKAVCLIGKERIKQLFKD